MAVKYSLKPLVFLKMKVEKQVREGDLVFIVSKASVLLPRQIFLNILNMTSDIIQKVGHSSGVMEYV